MIIDSAKCASLFFLALSIVFSIISPTHLGLSLSEDEKRGESKQRTGCFFLWDAYNGFQMQGTLSIPLNFLSKATINYDAERHRKITISKRMAFEMIRIRLSLTYLL